MFYFHIFLEISLTGYQLVKISENITIEIK